MVFQSFWLSAVRWPGAGGDFADFMLTPTFFYKIPLCARMKDPRGLVGNSYTDGGRPPPRRQRNLEWTRSYAKRSCLMFSTYWVRCFDVGLFANTHIRVSPRLGTKQGVINKKTTTKQTD